eukprot:817673-Pyramimonas_sp.AAC.1
MGTKTDRMSRSLRTRLAVCTAASAAPLRQGGACPTAAAVEFRTTFVVGHRAPFFAARPKTRRACIEGLGYAC